MLSRLAVAVILACLCGGVFAAEPRLLVFPERIELRGVDREHGVLVTRVEADGRKTDVTREAQFSSSAPAVMTVGKSGQAQAVADGAGELVVAVDKLSARVPVTVSGMAGAVVPSFRNDIEPILTKTGCNQGGCHGKLAGQNGFRLSLRGFAPEWDYGWITSEVNGRRIDSAFPAESLMVSKPTGGVAHEGGTRFRADSRAARALIDWIGARAPDSPADEPLATSLEVLPGDGLLRRGGAQQLLVRAHYADGRVRDVTWLAQFFSNDENIVSVKPSGLVHAVREGETSVRVHFQSQVSVVRFTLPFEREVAGADFTTTKNALDAPIFQKLAALRIPPSPDAGDAAFLRRAFLDTLGTLPTPEEAAEFLADPAADKRAKLADRLLARPEWVDYWTLQLADLLQNRKERDHDVRGVKGVRTFHGWLREQLAGGRGWADISRDVLLAKGNVTAQPQVGYYVTVIGEKNRVEESELPDSVAQAFLGTRIGCARCHNHPLERYTQDDFYHFAAFFGKVSLKRDKPELGTTELGIASREEREAQKQTADAARKLGEAATALGAAGESPVFAEQQKKLAEAQKNFAEQEKRLAEQRMKPPGAYQPRTNKTLPPRALDGVAWQGQPGRDAREQFVEWMVHDPMFSGAMVNRLWKHFFSVGLVEPVDDLRASNPPSNGELWTLLNREFVASKFDLRQIQRLILTSRAYQLASTSLPTNATETRFYSHYYARRLPAEVLLDGIAAATDSPQKFDGYPLGTRAIQLPDSGVGNYFLTLFGRSDRVTACACERKGEVTLPQLLHLKNGDEMQKQIASGRLAALLKEPDNKKVTAQLFGLTVSRAPSDAELAAINQQLAGDTREAVFADLFWALLNSKEFAFNH
jgi:hypothetical protein